MKSLLRRIRPIKPLKELTWIDLIIITMILCGNAIYTSTMQWIASFSATETVETGVLSFSPADNWWALANQGKLFLFALVYLLIRNYDFKQLKVKLEWRVLLWGPLIFIGAGLISDLAFTAFSYIPGLSGGYNFLGYLPYYDWNIMTVLNRFLAVDYSTVIYSLFNGFYEEFFFLGLLLSTDKKKRSLVVLFSTIVRISFHTYQGMVSALVIGVAFGLFYYYMYTRKNDNLLPYFLGHALADMVGTSFFSLFIAG
ncbi:TPA: CPBP family intramembrane metalloprotease [Streptococcus suis]|nr:CPBP family intramembrane metalloprotease [Streptococcus suis]HEM5326998.1 CPBP family intramembrane metalloprotease [Streptococcus suis]